MADRIELLEATIATLAAENRQLQAKVENSQQLIHKRAVTNFVEMVDGLDVTIEDARNGSQPARLMLRTFIERFDAAKELASPIEVVHRNGVKRDS